MLYLIIGRTQNEDLRKDVVYGVCRSMRQAEEVCRSAEAQDELRYYFWFPVMEIED